MEDLARRGTRRAPLLLAALAALAALPACNVGPDYQAPQIEVPGAFRSELADGLGNDTPDDAAWWRGFHDPALDELVAMALAQNLDLRASLARLDAARAQLGIAGADRLPSITGNASYTYRKESENTPFGAFIPRTDIHQGSFDAAWELDLWGRVRRSVEAADRELAASHAETRAAALSVAAEVARTWIDLLAARRRLAIARDNLALQERTLELVRARAAAGLVVERDVAQAGTNVETTRSRLPQLETAAAIAENRLSVLLGRAPGDLPAAVAGRDTLPSLPVAVAVGVPADLLRRRPDVVRAERRYAAEIARIGVTEADRYPRISLSGQLGLGSNTASEFFDRDSDLSGFGPTLRWNLFDNGRTSHRVRAVEASAEALRHELEQTVLVAIEETEAALTGYVREQARREALARAATEARRAVELARTQYTEGLSDFQAVLDSERVVATIEDDLASSTATVTANLIALYKALGGGFGGDALAR